MNVRVAEKQRQQPRCEGEYQERPNTEPFQWTSARGEAGRRGEWEALYYSDTSKAIAYVT